MSLSIGLLIPYHAFAQTSPFYFYTLNTLFRHVHGFLEEIGQGVQHIASRVDDIISFVQEANDRRKIFGEVGTHVMLSVASYHSHVHTCSITLCPALCRLLFLRASHFSTYLAVITVS